VHLKRQFERALDAVYKQVLYLDDLISTETELAFQLSFGMAPLLSGKLIEFRLESLIPCMQLVACDELLRNMSTSKSPTFVINKKECGGPGENIG
jgi:hypothetical protein